MKDFHSLKVKRMGANDRVKISVLKNYWAYEKALLSSTEKVMPFTPAKDFVKKSKLTSKDKEMLDDAMKNCKKSGKNAEARKKYKCRYKDDKGKKCGVSNFYTPSMFHKHLDTHLSLKFYRCKICSQTYQQEPGCLSHIKSHQFLDTFSCKLCNITFTRKDNLSQHIDEGHADTDGKLFDVDKEEIVFRPRVQSDLLVKPKGRGQIRQSYFVPVTNPEGEKDGLACSFTHMEDVKDAARGILKGVKKKEKLGTVSTGCGSLKELLALGYTYDPDDAVSFLIFSHGKYSSNKVKLWLRRKLQAHCIHKRDDHKLKFKDKEKYLVRAIKKVYDKLPKSTQKLVDKM
ncbi:zinc finger protein 597 isoform X1 [Folsomia candida]|nr:zinc finger protein 597 isoform X1 [Folsomia candida]